MKYLFTSFSVLFINILFAQTAIIKGHLSGDGNETLTGAMIVIPGQSKGITTDAEGFFTMTGIHPGNVIFRCTAPEMDTLVVSLKLYADSVHTVEWKLKPSYTIIGDVVVTGTRTQRRRLDSPVAVNILEAKTFERTQSVCLAEGLSFQPGLRMETDCQTCNYTQLRMNGLGGSYAQVLINGRPLFSSLMGLYGLEQIPSNAIDRVEVVRGSGSVLYGSNAIAGTINVLTKLPQTDAMSVQGSYGLVGGTANDVNVQTNLVVVNDSATAGVTVFASLRNRDALDVNSDGYSEMPQLNGVSVGLSGFLKISPYQTLEASLWHIQEERRGGNALDSRPDQADQAEYRLQNSDIGQLTYTWNSRSRKSSLQLFTGGQLTRRTHYTGIDHADGWGQTHNLTANSGMQFNRRLRISSLGKMELNMGAEHTVDDVYDAIPAYNYLIDQFVQQWGFFVQSDWEISKRWTVLPGVRMNLHSLLQQPVYTPRFSVLFKPVRSVQIRAGYGRGYKAPQAFETDMHIAFASGGVATIQRAAGLQSELSDSWSFSADWNQSRKRHFTGLTLSAFATVLHNVFVLTEQGQDSLGNTILLRDNGGDARVYGTTLEGRWKWEKWLQADAGFTIQRSFYSTAVAWSNSVPATTRFLRTPNEYGFANVTLFPDAKWSGTVAAVYTGSMLVPHFGGAPENPQDILKTTDSFVDCTIRLAYSAHLHRIEQNLEIALGVQNLLDQYQSDFDTGKNRDSNYIYGPAKPRTVFISLKWSGTEH